ncbi:hypothetical protein DY000_02054519 [Brassica cretica]|uniref:Uncharacterized protein n=1 Tax=Brassica cretica TaxID=69181 RepID=A0ABQ7ADL1_BRACR|nr:hypothetical protein DY000_02054519 [Brassica cretica]
MEIARHMDIYASSALYGDCGAYIVYIVVVLCTESVVCGLVSHSSRSNSHATHPSFFLPIAASSTPFSIEEKTGVTIWYQSGVPSRLRPGMAIYGIQISTVFNVSELRRRPSLCSFLFFPISCSSSFIVDGIIATMSLSMLVVLQPPRHVGHTTVTLVPPSHHHLLTLELSQPTGETCRHCLSRRKSPPLRPRASTKMLCERHIVWRLRDIETFVLAAHCMEIVGHMDVYASGALYGDCGVQRRLY